ncbi:hypothetical protein [Enterobacter roggenkampii]|uniref:hypothetical protein n=1 Tax=Enterobacter roggenkampii TaxID=1812935 RepID=UPI001C707986|nr:hypothetical protein [Enterobacter roggenkampii]MBW9419947.1 hypothetical protein [Enterobacter roggenkampii]
MKANKPMTGEQLDELMTVAVNMQRDAETDCNRPSAMFAYAVQVAVLELRKVRNDASALAAENAGLKESRKNLAEFIHEELDAGYPLNMSIETPATDAFLAEVRAQGVKSLSNAVQSVISERQRQQSVEGWTPEHDDEHTEGEMAEAAACYAMFANNQGFSVPGLWPWAREWWKQSGQRRDLVKAGALILAEIERIDRQESAQ